MRFGPSRAAAPALSMGRLLTAGTLLVLALGSVIGWLAGRHGQSDSGITVDSQPVLIAMQKIGELHSAKFLMRDVLHAQTEQQPTDTFAAVPGISSIVHWPTRNQALVTVEGTVEAGIDLSGLKPQDVTVTRSETGPPTISVRLPGVHLYPVTVRLHVEQERSGPFYRDQNLIPKAEEEAKSRLASAAETAGIRESARSNALDTLNRLQSVLGFKNVRFYF